MNEIISAAVLLILIMNSGLTYFHVHEYMN